MKNALKEYKEGKIVSSADVHLYIGVFNFYLGDL